MGKLVYSTSAVPVIPGHNGGRSQTNVNILYGGEYPFINIMKHSAMPIVSDATLNTITPDMLDALGYPNATYHGFWYQPLMPLQSERPGNYIITWDGTGAIVGTGAGGRDLFTASFTGSITGNVLNVPGAITGTIEFGQRVTGGTTLPYTFIMNQIDATHYTVSRSQTVASTAMTANGGSSTSSGAAGAGYYAQTIAPDVGSFQFHITSVGTPTITNIQIYHVDDAAQVAAGEIFSTRFLQRIREANFGVIRFINWQDGNGSNVTTWRTRKTNNYITYLGDQMNNSFYAGTAAHTSNNFVTSKFPALHSSDGTAWTSGGPKDRDTVHVLYTNSAVQSGTCSLSINGSPPINILSVYTGPLSGAAAFYPKGGGQQSLSTLIYDQLLNGWIQYGGNDDQGARGFVQSVPHEAMLQLCLEVGAHPYFISPPLCLDPATDYMAELGAACKAFAIANAPWMIPRFEGPNETWTFGQHFYQTQTASNKAKAHVVANGWISTADFPDEYGKWMANHVQKMKAVYGTLHRIRNQVLCGVHTFGSPSESDEKLKATQYANQTGPADPSITGSFGTISFT